METSNIENIGRFYQVPGGKKFPSVTTVLQVATDKTFLDDWRERIGNEKADAIVQEACDIGNTMHESYECHLKGLPLPIVTTPAEKKGRQLFKSSLAKFNHIMESVIHQEVPVFSEELEIAGRFDLLGITKQKKIALLDFKNTRRDKLRTDIDAYKLQLAFYLRMIKHTLNIEVEEMIVFMVNRDGFTKIFRFRPDEVSDAELFEIRQKFRDIYSY